MPFHGAWPLASSPAAPLALGPQATISLLGTGFLVVGLVVIAVMISVAVSGSRFRRRALRTTGTIVARQRTSSNRYDSNNGGGVTYSYSYYSIVEFTTEDGSPARARSRVASNPPAGKIGAVVPVLYDPADPSQVAIDNGRSRIMSGCAVAVASVIAAVFLIAGAIMLASGLR